jgi:hypothetical protein
MLIKIIKFNSKTVLIINNPDQEKGKDDGTDESNISRRTQNRGRTY